MTSSHLRRLRTRAADLVLTVTALLGVVLASMLVLAVATGVRPIIFRSGSMEPTVATGALGFSRDASAGDLVVGDIVTVTNQDGETVTHRVVSVDKLGERAALTLKGDDNPVPDRETYTVSHAPRLWFSIPKLGYIIAWFANSPGSYLLGAYVALMLVLAFRRGSASPIEEASRLVDDPPPANLNSGADGTGTPSRSRTSMRVVGGALVVLALGTAVSVGRSAQPTWAEWNDSVTVSATLGTGTLGPALLQPAVTCGPTDKKSVSFKWDPVGGSGTTYDIYYPNATTKQVNPTPSATSFTLSGSAQMVGSFFVVAHNGGASSPMSSARTYNTGTGADKGACS